MHLLPLGIFSLASLTLSACVNTQTVGEYHSTSTLNYRGETITQQRHDRWTHTQPATHSIAAYVGPQGTSVDISASTPANPSNNCLTLVPTIIAGEATNILVPCQ